MSGTYSVGYTYNYVGALKQISYTANAWTKSVNYDYNYAGGATTVGTNMRTGTTTNNVVTAFDYRAWGGLQKADFANGRRLALSYDQKRTQLSNLKLLKTDGTDTVSDLSYDYYNGGNNNGRIQKITDGTDASYTATYGYDDYHRLTSASATAYSRSYSYDAWGNLTGVTASGAGESGSYSLSYATNGSSAPSTNRISNTGYTFDSAGNVTNDGALAYTYDAASRLKTAGGDAYQYDGDGHRVRNQVNGYSNALYYLWSSVLNEPVVEIDSTTPSVFRAYVYSPGGQMLAVQSYDGGFYWLHTDVLSSGRKLTNSSGAVIYRGDYDPHGQMVYEWASGGATYLNSHKFTGYERDWSTNLDNAKARTYNHNRARFMQPDPLSLGAADLSDPQSLNLYSYVGNDPVNFTDPSGLNKEDDTIRIDTYAPYLDNYAWLFWRWLFYSGGGYLGGGGSGGDMSGGGGEQGPNQQNDTPCGGINPITGERGFSPDPRGETGRMRPGVGGQGDFGARRRRAGGGRRPHFGLDISAFVGDDIYATASGTVTFAGSGGDYGRWIQIDHGNGITSRYAHNSQNSVRVGDQVQQGQVIGTVGRTGNAARQRATEDHVHFEVRRNANGRSVPVDPALFLNIPCNWSLSR